MGTRRSRSLYLGVAALVVLTGAWPLRSLGAAEPTGAGAAFAVSITSLATPLVPPTPGGVAGAGSGGFPAVRAAAPALGVPGLASVAGLRAATDGTQKGAVSSSAALDAITVAGGLVSAGAASSTCLATASSAQGSAVVSALSVGGSALPVSGAPNTRIEVPGLVVGILNEQVSDTGPGRSGIVVRAAHLQVRLGTPGTELLEVVVAESRCSVETGPTVPTPAPPLVTETSRPVRPSSTLPTATTTARPTSTITTSTTVPGPVPTPPTTSGVAASSSPAVVVETAGGSDSGRGGSLLTVVGTGFERCDNVVIHFDDQRIGVAHPDAAGALSERGLSVPGDANDGAHVVAASCRPEGRLLRAAATFQVVEESGVHRSAFVTSLARPDQVGTSARSLLLSAMAALGLLLAIAFPSQLFNSTLDENYDEVRGWFGFRKPHDHDGGHQALEFIGFVLLGGLLYGLLSPDLRFDRSSAALVLGLCLSLVVVSLGFRLPHLLYVHHRDGEWGRLRVLPGTALVAVICVGVSRLVDFQPGYLYGLIAGLAIRRQLATDTSGALTAVSAVTVFSLSLAAWLARAPVSQAAGGDDPSIWLVAIEAGLAAITILGIETVVICLIPLRFVEGSKLAAWSRTAWALTFGVVAFGFVHILLRPDSGYVAPGASRLTVLILFVCFGLVSISFWAYFRFRPARVQAPPAPAPAPVT